MNYLPLLNGLGWVFFDTCVCGGIKFDKFNNPKHPGWEIWVSPELEFFRVWDADQQQKGEDRTLDRLENTIVLNHLN